jgi:hypothetical protein
MRKTRYLGMVLLVVLPACSSQETGLAPGPPPPALASAPGSITILFSNGQGNLGTQSFSPNRSSQGQGGVVWHNDDTTTHHIVSDDGSFDTGNIAPGSTSPAKWPSQGGGPYHCTIHPTMVGTIIGYWDY